MTSDLLLRNLAIWSLQIFLPMAVAWLFPALARLKAPPAKLLFWQLALLTCLALPLMEPWQQHVAANAPVTFAGGARLILPPHPHHPQSLPSLSDVIVWALLLGVGLRLALICVGFYRLGKYRRSAVPLAAAPAWASEAALLVSDEIGSPVTFGFLRPVVLLPAAFPNLPEAARDAILCHEILHVRRRDWLFTLAEEFVRAALWFHPGIWWALGEIQLAREQTVDLEAVRMMNSRDEYVDALLTVAGAASRLDVAPAPLFLRKRHLKQRVLSILKEVRMSHTRTFSTLAAGLVLLAASCWLITGALPLQGAPQTVADAEGVAVELNGAQLMHRSPVGYPPQALRNGIQGSVVAQVRTDASGNPVDASILSGPDELRKAVLQSVLSWHFAKSGGDLHQVTINFSLPAGAGAAAAERPAATAAVRSGVFAGSVPPPPPGGANAESSRILSPPAQPRTIASIEVDGLSDEARDELIKNLPYHVGDSVSVRDLLPKLTRAAREFDEHLNVGVVERSTSEMSIRISAPSSAPPQPSPAATSAAASGKPIRVGSQVQAANLISQTPPEYPALAKEAGVQGVVTFEATIGTDGLVKNLKLVSGPPLLVSAAMQAVSQWQYKPTLLNGQPVDVLTTIAVNFTLAQ